MRLGSLYQFIYGSHPFLRIERNVKVNLVAAFIILNSADEITSAKKSFLNAASYNASCALTLGSDPNFEERFHHLPNVISSP